MSDGWDKWYRIRREARPIHEATSPGARESDALRYLLPIFLIGILVSAVILAWQLYTYLRFGEWPALSIISLLNGLQIGWARAPLDWIGLHALLDAIPLSLAVLAGGILPVAIWLWRDSRTNGKASIDWGE